ncbi:hypothetical protein PsorP6_011186 [Peronosclerospora sorghi]|uniref:Uncharacterized protein n=1 Tax=Peronosclerospora sorghi TaxID=230839 RepID=A0ACC0VVL1_9STRA|nr:hypothetical protein PsorP6_011186 [Peronosclerospora sorghi]
MILLTGDNHMVVVCNGCDHSHSSDTKSELKVRVTCPDGILPLFFLDKHAALCTAALLISSLNLTTKQFHRFKTNFKRFGFNDTACKIT